MSTEDGKYGTPYTETEILLAMAEQDVEHARALLQEMAPSERDTLEHQCEEVINLIQVMRGQTMSGMPHRKYPCSECPWQVDAEPGKFPAERYEQLHSTCRPDEAGIPPLPGSAMFGCHVGDPGTGEDLACAGWLAVEGHNHMGVRLAVMGGKLPIEALDRGSNWPELYESYEAMAKANGVATREGVP